MYQHVIMKAGKTNQITWSPILGGTPIPHKRFPKYYHTTNCICDLITVKEICI